MLTRAGDLRDLGVVGSDDEDVGDLERAVAPIASIQRRPTSASIARGDPGGLDAQRLAAP